MLFHATMGVMRLIVTGIGDAFSALHYGSSAVIEAPRGLVALDCPGGVLAMYRGAAKVSGIPIDLERLDDIGRLAAMVSGPQA